MATATELWARLSDPARRFVAESGRFILVGTLGTIGYLVLYVVAESAMQAVVANVAAWLVSTIATNEAHRRVTFAVRDSRRADGAVSMVTSVIGLVVSSVCVNLVADESTALQLVMLVAGTVTSGTLRFFLLRHWFHDRDHGGIDTSDRPIVAAA